ncbi:substrate-binding domain-containing protein [Flavobacterium aciduliphilum]|uniref:NMT1/THI5 like protein n=1 Tax=Flavobacterium aciduliphilum TaxID=1101402 RepID=A0A328YIL3_9FLAO|nr:substrate-binding domain-containing protein [Flavobacterium aciduliphilum]RAR73891.1 NMT1/THI5 like protein [Flavobacterium aciduliphilum]
MKTIRIAGVPEHFNHPWKMALAEHKFQDAGLAVTWTDVPEGTGKMCQMLREGVVDIAVILTEGIIKDIVNGNPSRIVQSYVNSPLLWGIHVHASSNYFSLEDLQDKKVAISRYGSGSHLMAIVNALQQGWNTDQLQFEVVHTVEGAVEALEQGKTDYFMWEKFMTKPLVDQGVFRWISDCPTPWPSFVISVREEFIQEEKNSLEIVLSIINSVTSNFKEIPFIEEILSNTFQQKQDDIRAWLSLTHWGQDSLTNDVVEKIQNQLFNMKIIEHKIPVSNLIYSL